MAGNRYLDDFTAKLDINNPDVAAVREVGPESVDAGLVGLNNTMKQKILQRTRRKVGRRAAITRYIAAAFIGLIIISYFTPNTPVFALRQAVLSFIPGIGVVRTDDDAGIITDVLASPVRVTDGEKFVEIRSGFIKGNIISISGLTDVGTLDPAALDSIEEFKRYYSEAAVPQIHLVQGDEKIKAGQVMWAGPSFETALYKINACFYLDQKAAGGPYVFDLDGFDRPIEIFLAPAKSGSGLEEMGNGVVIDGVMAFANVTRDNNLVEALVSIVAPGEWQNPRGYLFDHERTLFESGVYLIDEEGARYEADEDLRRSRDSEIYTFYFHVPEDRKGLQLVIPQILFEYDYRENDLKIAAPRGEKVVINKRVQLGDHTISFEQASLLTAGDEMLPEDLKPYGSLMIEAGATTENGSRESVLRIVPEIMLSGSGLGSPRRVSQSVYADPWGLEQSSGQSFVCFDDRQKAKKIIINFKLEVSMAGPWEIPLAGE